MKNEAQNGRAQSRQRHFVDRLDDQGNKDHPPMAKTKDSYMFDKCATGEHPAHPHAGGMRNQPDGEQGKSNAHRQPAIEHQPC